MLKSFSVGKCNIFNDKRSRRIIAKLEQKYNESRADGSSKNNKKEKVEGEEEVMPFCFREGKTFPVQEIGKSFILN